MNCGVDDGEVVDEEMESKVTGEKEGERPERAYAIPTSNFGRIPLQWPWTRTKVASYDLQFNRGKGILLKL